ncbi:NUDIX hydrolase [Sedimentitalea sp. HM32M-2]|uniref:NUDIX hydrolase n=1 Tax=Sedimentitalea sp. HM32M-2 TaxID=3351566 RepID=UPI003639B9DB
MTFSGAKLAVFLGSDLLVIRRDDRPDIPWPDYWDLPGGGREGSETPAQCALRETREEVGLVLQQSDLVWSNNYRRPHGIVWFFAAHLPERALGSIRFGNEGQGWQLMAPGEFCEHPMAVPHFTTQVRLYLAHPDCKPGLSGKTPRC